MLFFVGSNLSNHHHLLFSSFSSVLNQGYTSRVNIQSFSSKFGPSKDIQTNLDSFKNNLSKKEQEYHLFIDEQKNSGDFDYLKKSELLKEIEEIKMNIGEKEKILGTLV